MKTDFEWNFFLGSEFVNTPRCWRVCKVTGSYEDKLRLGLSMSRQCFGKLTVVFKILCYKHVIHVDWFWFANWVCEIWLGDGLVSDSAETVDSFKAVLKCSGVVPVQKFVWLGFFSSNVRWCAHREVLLLFVYFTIRQNADAYIAQNKVNRNIKKYQKGQSKLHTIVSELFGTRGYRSRSEVSFELKSNFLFSSVTFGHSLMNSVLFYHSDYTTMTRTPPSARTKASAASRVRIHLVKVKWMKTDIISCLLYKCTKIHVRPITACIIL